MPKSSKKKKSAVKRRKRKASATTTSQSPPTNSQQGDVNDEDEDDDENENGDVKTHVEKVNNISASGESGDASSPTLKDHNHIQHNQHHRLMEREEEKRDFCSSVEESTSDMNNNKPMLGGSEMRGGDKHPSKREEVAEVVEVVRDVKTFDGTLESETVCVEEVESAKESGNGGSPGSSYDSVSGEEESQLVEKKQYLVMEESRKLKEKVEDSSSIAEAMARDDTVEQAVSVIEETATTSEQGVEITQIEKVEDLGTINGEHCQASAVPESSQNQEELVPLIQPPLRPTSWKSCCGLFDCLVDSNR